MPLMRHVTRRLMQQQRQYTQVIEPVNLAFRLHTTKQQPDDDPDVSPPFVIMHGVLGVKDNWRSISQQLAYQTGRRVFSVDARNHGDSPYTDLHSTKAMVVDMVEFMKTHRLAKICALGHSMGGRCMMMLALKHPELVERAIIVDISPFGVPTHFHLINAIFDALLKVKLPRHLSHSEAREMLMQELHKHNNNDPEGAKIVLRNLRKHKSTGEFYMPANVKAVHNNWIDFSRFRDDLLILPPYTGPILFIAGKKSKFFKKSNMKDIQKWFPNTQLEWLNANHALHHEDPKGFLELVLHFMDKKQPQLNN
ncbi:uncharacterized protein Dwil_GK19111 [Drosophila willistoni]|uniref:sn-1-specific diacylglycerol lipase ABHD11 n=1 Tax=Drosophila willistoni TaxID=7260 RepID=B4NFL4_DROWI|nr:protein ABHD11 [Drosophila willistoni]EDW83081.1 uncharacterized protein Dwil_GK19111 [Drosophila willistoni]